MSASSTRHRRPAWGTALAAALGAALLVTLVLTAFIWPTATAKVRDLPIGMVGAGSQSTAISSKLQESGAFAVTTFGSRESAVAAIERRELYGAVVVGNGPSVEVLTASAASPVAAQLLGQVAAQTGQGLAQEVAGAKAQAAQAAAQAGAQAAAAQASYQTMLSVQQKLPEVLRPTLQALVDQAKAKADAAAAEAAKAKAAVDALSAPSVTVTDVVPLVKGDARGAALAMAALPIALGGLVGGSLLALTVTGRLRRVTAVVLYAALGGLGMTAVMHWWFHLLPGSAWGLWGIFSLALAATAATMVGLHAVLGAPGLALGGVLTMLVGNPLSAAQVPVEFLPSPWGAVGQGFVPGAATTAIRQFAYFPQAPLLVPLAVLAAWALVGTALAVAGREGRRP